VFLRKKPSPGPPTTRAGFVPPGLSTKNHHPPGRKPAQREGEPPCEPRCVSLREKPSPGPPTTRAGFVPRWTINQKPPSDRAKNQRCGRANLRVSPAACSSSKNRSTGDPRHPSRTCPERAPENSRGSSAATPPVHPPSNAQAPRKRVRERVAGTHDAGPPDFSPPDPGSSRAQPRSHHPIPSPSAWEDGGSAGLPVHEKRRTAPDSKKTFKIESDPTDLASVGEADRWLVGGSAARVLPLPQNDVR
jgi:hypothetical protein